MYKILKKSLLVVSLLILGSGCNNSSSKAQVVENKVESSHKTENKTVDVKPKVLNMAKEAAEVFYSTFQDTAKIGPNGKEMILVFGANTDPYTMKLKEDIFKSKEIQARLQNDFSSYYFKASDNLRCKLYHEGEYMDVDTKTLISIYGISGTPTIIFTDMKGKAVIVVPGYMPTKQFLVTMDFMQSNKWKGKDRKNGEVYQALKDFYLSNGIKIKKAK